MKHEKKYYKKLHNKNSIKGFANYLVKHINTTQEVVFLCIGTPYAMFDSIGPKIGSRLNCHHKYTIYGVEKNAVHANNLVETINKIHEEYSNPFIIAIDASLGTVQHVGMIVVSMDSIKPGAGVHKILPSVGNLSICCIVDTILPINVIEYLYPSEELCKRVYNFVDFVANGIEMAYSEIEQKKNLVDINTEAASTVEKGII